MRKMYLTDIRQLTVIPEGVLVSGFDMVHGGRLYVSMGDGQWMWKPGSMISTEDLWDSCQLVTIVDCQIRAEDPPCEFFPGAIGVDKNGETWVLGPDLAWHQTSETGRRWLEFPFNVLWPGTPTEAIVDHPAYQPQHLAVVR